MKTSALHSSGAVTTGQVTTAELLRSENPIGQHRETNIPAVWKRFHARLLDLRMHLLMESGVIARDAMDTVVVDPARLADSATDSYSRDFALGLLSSKQDALNEVEQAIHRIEDGTYGICELTGNPIPLERLNAIPWARFGVEVQTQIEREAEVDSKISGKLHDPGG